MNLADLSRWGVAVACLSCSPDLDPPTAREPDAGATRLSVDGAGCCVATPHSRFSFSKPAKSPFPLVFQGSVSAYQQARLDSDQLSSTLLERQVQLFMDERGVFVPLTPLLAAEQYTIARSEEQVWVVEVEPGSLPTFARAWPPDNEATRFAVFCSEAAIRGQALSLPTGLTAVLIPGRNHCFGILADSGAETQLSPKSAFGADLQATVLQGTVSQATVSQATASQATASQATASQATATSPSQPQKASCGPGEQPLGPACVTVFDDRLRFSVQPESYWLFTGSASWSTAAAGGGAFLPKGFEAEQPAHVKARVIERGGREWQLEADLVLGAARPHVVLSEVLADPLGPEPSQEWIELYNDGPAPVQLEGFRLADAGGSVELPAYELGSEGYLVLVRDDFDLGALSDVPLNDAPLLRLEQLGTSGLSNSGEPLTLSDAAGTIVSRFLPVKAKPGQSVARERPECPDEAVECYGYHAEPGASPAGPNSVE